MSPTRRALILIAGLLAPFAARAQSPGATSEQEISQHLGIAVQSDGHTCLETADAHLASGQAVLLIIPTSPQRAVPAQITGPAPNCKRAGDPAYALHPSEALPDDLILAAAIAGHSMGRSAGTVRIAAPGLPPLLFRTCTSSEGVHVTAWRGAPLRSERLWHHYVPLGMDVDSTCTAQDTK